MNEEVDTGFMYKPLEQNNALPCPERHVFWLVDAY